MFEQVTRQLPGKPIWMCTGSTEYESNNAEQPLSCAIIAGPQSVPTYSVCYKRKIEEDVKCQTASQRPG